MDTALDPAISKLFEESFWIIIDNMGHVVHSFTADFH